MHKEIFRSIFLFLLSSAVMVFVSCGTRDEHLQPLRYIALGDSYTIGEGVEESQRFPNLLVSGLVKAGIPVELVANPAQTGWTTEDVLTMEIPLFEKSNPQFATLLIGVNDWVQGFTEERFRVNFILILERMLDVLPSSRRLIVITIPDFSKTPEGSKYARGRDISAGIAAFNAIILEESWKKGVASVDIFGLSQEMNNDTSLIAADGLHPSGLEYELWAKKVLHVAQQLLRK